MLAAIPKSASRAADLGRALDLDPALAWRIHALANQTDVLLGAQSVPRPGSMERFLEAAVRVAPADAARGARSAYEAFEQMVAAHAGDRDTFDAMLTLQRPEDSTGLRRVRRTAHRGNAAAWGVNCRAMVHAVVFSDRPTGELDSLTVIGHVGIQRLHAEAMVTLLASPLVWGGGPLRPDGVPSASNSQFELIESACSQPLPRVDSAVSNGSCRDILVMDGLGRQSDTTVYTRSASMAIPGATAEPPYDSATTCRVPTEVIFADLLVPRSWGGGGARRSTKAWITPDLGPSATEESTLKYKLPFEGACQHLGTSLAALYCAAVPQYTELVQSEIARMGWAEKEFDIFRCEVQYPLLHSVVHLSVE